MQVFLWIVGAAVFLFVFMVFILPWMYEKGWLDKGGWLDDMGW